MMSTRVAAYEKGCEDAQKKTKRTRRGMSQISEGERVDLIHD
jgi:hypothetical protein